MVYGNIMSLLDKTLSTTSLSGYYCFGSLFVSNDKLVDASNLQLPASELSESCYANMFSACSNLTAAPAELPATELAEWCYSAMFNLCSRLSYVKAMFKNTPDEDAYTWKWLDGVSPTGVFIKNKDATWNVTGVYAVPSGWTVITE